MRSSRRVVATLALTALALAGCGGSAGTTPVRSASGPAATAGSSPIRTNPASTPSKTPSKVTPVALPVFDMNTDPFEIERDLRKIVDILTTNAVGVPDDLRHPDVQSVGQEVCGINNVLPAEACSEGDPNDPNGRYYLFISVENARNQFKLGGHDLPGVYSALASAYANYISAKRLQRVNPKLLTLGDFSEVENRMRIKAIVCTYGEVLGGMRKAGIPLAYAEKAHSNLVGSDFYKQGAEGKACI